MKNYKYLIVTCLLLITVSCKKSLDIKPLGVLSPATFYNTESELDFALTELYSMVRVIWRNDRFSGYAMDGDEGYVYGGATVSVNIGSFNSPASDRRFLQEWRGFYQAIYQANMLLENVNKNPNLDSAIVSRIKGEALFLRAYFYFYCVETWGDVPLILKAATNPFQILVARTPVKEVYLQIIKDMEAAEPLVSSITSLGFGGRVSKSAVRGFLARVNLHMAGALNDKSRFVEVSKWAKMVMDDPIAQHALNPSFSQVFINYAKEIYDIKESIFEIEYNGVKGVGDLRGYVGNVNGPNGTVRATKTYFDNFKPGDLRRDWTIANFIYKDAKYSAGDGITYNDTTKLYNLWNKRPGKFRREYENSFDGSSTTPQNYPLLRYSDVLLMYAEAENELDHPQLAIDVVNQVRERAWSSGIKSVEITAGGSGYTTPPMVVFHGGGGKEASATAILDTLTGKVTGIQFEIDRVTGFKNGNSYSSEPTIEFVGGGGTGASAIATIYSLSDADLTTEETLNKENLRNAILQERSYELGFECLRRFDLNRHHLFVERMHDVASQIVIDNIPGFNNLYKFSNVTDRDVLWPIPQEEITLNTLMTQNPGW